MALSVGTRLGPYEIINAIGAGGMGEVYRARDTKLGRDVAVKALPDVFARDTERLARFGREAQVLGALNHPNLAVIHELREADGSNYLIMELVEGQTLAEKLQSLKSEVSSLKSQGRGSRLPLDEALGIASQIAEGLEAAHEKGIVHRDLKPANIKITPEGRVKVLDFGLAKLGSGGSGGSGGPGGQNLTASPTLSAMQLAGGMIMGTAAYMSPEQARGKDVDRRADVWAFGCVLYEMLAGQRPFAQGETVSDTLAHILAREPDWQALPPGTPTKIRALLERCLRKDERRRWSGMADVRNEIEEARSERNASVARPASSVLSPRRVPVLNALALLFLLTTVGVTLRLLFGPSPEAHVLRSEFYGPTGTAVLGLDSAELSPDGRKLAFLAPSDGKRLIWVRPLDSTAQPLPGTEGTGTDIFWSADSQFVAFSAEGKLKKVAASGGPSQVVGSLAANTGYSGTWSSDEVILVGSEGGGPLLRVSRAGGQLAPATELDTSRKETSHAYPSFLPDGKHFLYLARSSDPQHAFAAYVGDLSSKERRALPGIASKVKYSATSTGSTGPTGGHVVFIREGALVAQPFDVKRLALTGEAFPVADAVVPERTAVAGSFSVSSTGGLAYLRPFAQGTGSLDQNFQLGWFDRTGRQLALAGPEGPYATSALTSLLRTGLGDTRVSGGPELSPDGKSLAFSRDSPADIWVLDIEKRLTSRLTSDLAADSFPVWSPDSRTIAFRSERDGLGNLYERTVGVVGEDKLLLKDESSKFPTDWSRDGQYLAYHTAAGDIWALPVSGDASDRKPRRVTQTPFIESDAKFSPDGRWIAYVSNEPGRAEVYVQSFPEPGFKQPISTAGGIMPRWSSDGKELFFIEFPNLMTVAVKPSGSSLQFGAPSTLFSSRGPFYNVRTDGRVLLYTTFNPGGSSLPARLAHIVVINNWAASRRK